jgi:hypothetical protein
MRVDGSAIGSGVLCQLAPGMRLGSCELLLRIARGGMAQVWAARQHGARGFNRLVALKTVLPELAEPEFEALFLDEARLAARIHHPNVCEVFELVEDRGVLGLAMEWIDGDTLHALLKSPTERIDARIAAHVVAEVASGLHAAHELRDESGVPLGLVHRDVSPHNVLISRDGRVKVADFGVAKAVGASREQTASGQIRGKLNYLSPEQAREAPLDRRSDVFSLGILLYVATVAAHPFSRRGERKERQVVNLLMGRVTPPSAVVPHYPKPLEAIVLKAMRHDPNKRFATADEMRRELVGWLTRSGGLVGERDVARVLRERQGFTIERRAEQVAAALRASRDRGTATASSYPSGHEPSATVCTDGSSLGLRAASSVPAAEPTVVLSAALRARRRHWLRRTVRLGLPLVAAGSVGVLGILSFTVPPAQPHASTADAAAADLTQSAALPRPASTFTSLVQLERAASEQTAAPAASPPLAPSTKERSVGTGSMAAPSDNTDSNEGAPAAGKGSTATTSTEPRSAPATRTKPSVPRAARGSPSTASSSAAPASVAPDHFPRGSFELGPREDEL